MISNTAKSVMILETHLLPVNGIDTPQEFWSTFLSTCSITTTTLVAEGLLTRSIAPPIPFTLPGNPQLAKSPFDDTCKPPNIVKSILPPLIIPKDSSDPNKEAPGAKVTVSLPALIKSGSSSPF